MEIQDEQRAKGKQTNKQQAWNRDGEDRQIEREGRGKIK